MLQLDSLQAATETDEEIDELDDGPCDVNMFRYKGLICNFTETSWQLLNYLWEHPRRRALCDDAIENLWGGGVSKAAVETAATRINKRMKQKCIPLSVRIKSRFVFIQDEQA